MSSVAFAEAARRLGASARGAGFDAPTFRSPPRQAGVSRSIRRRSDGSCLVSIRIADRPVAAMLADMIDGIVAANTPTAATARSPRPGVDPAALAQLRDELWLAVTPLLQVSEGVSASPAASSAELEHRLAA